VKVLHCLLEFLKIPQISTPVLQIVLENPHGLRAEITNYGATLMRLQVPDKYGNLVDVVSGYNDPKGYFTKPYTNHNFCMGATIGRYAGRLSGGGFLINGDFYPITNVKGVQLHGGDKAFDKQFWELKERGEGEEPFVVFTLNSEDGSNGFPGNLEVQATYILKKEGLQIYYEATTDALTVLNLTNHAYFHLDDSGSVEGNILSIAADSILHVDERLVPTGRMMDVTNTPYDYREEEPLHFQGHFGLDTPYVLKRSTKCAHLYSPKSGIHMEVSTDQPGLVVFTPQEFPNMGLRNQDTYGDFPAICFECQNFPDAPNNPNFPSSVLKPGERYKNDIFYRFSIK